MNDEHKSNVDGSTYDLEKYSTNYMIIFNHEYFFDNVRREGTAEDEASLRETFDRFRFKVTTHNNLDRTELLDELTKFGQQNFDSCGCICVAILTHGYDHGYLEARDGPYSERQVFACFNTSANETLVGKPIIFLIQACRGPNLASSVSINPLHEKNKIELDSTNTEGKGHFLPTDTDIIIFYSCFFGKASARAWKNGTWFIQTLCQQINEHAASEHLEKIGRRVKKIIALEKEYNHGKQMPMTYSTLIRKLFFIRKENTETQ